MWNKALWTNLGRDLTEPGETLVCAVSGGADSIAMLFAFYLNREKLGIHLEAAHFNHQLRGRSPSGTKHSSGLSATNMIFPFTLAVER